jgi:hypothetical protein
MPIPRTYDLPGKWGINLQEKDALLNPNWATKTESLVLDERARLQCRGGLNIVSTDGAAGEILRAHIYIDADGDETVITSQADRIVSGIADLDDVSTDITSSTTPTNGFWQFVNFNGKVLGFQAGEAPIVKTTGDFADIVASAGTLPDGDVALAAYGRVWAVDDDRQTIRYCALLDETDWSTASGGGSIDMRNVWTKGMDYVTGLAAFGGTLVVFGRNHIVMYTDGQGSVLGIDPTQMYVVDTIEGTGCVSRDSIASVGEGDLIFLSANGVQSLRRLIVQKDNPLETISWQIADQIKAAVQTELEGQTDPKLDVRGFTGNYIDSLGQYWLIHNNGSVEDVYIFQMTARTQEENGKELVPCMFWDTSVLTNLRNIVETNEKLVYVTGGATHEIYQYSLDSNTDEGSTAIAVDFETGWIFDEDPMAKVLKFGQITLLNVDQVSSATTFKYATDYQASLDTIAGPTTDDGRVVNLYDPVGDVEGQYFKLGITDTAFGGKVLQQIKLYLEPANISFIHQKFDDYTAPQAIEDAGSVDRPVMLDAQGGIVDSLLDLPTYQLTTSGTTEDTLTVPAPPTAEGVAVFMVAPSGQGTIVPTVDYGGNSFALGGLDGSTGSTSYIAWVAINAIASSPNTDTMTITWSSAPSAGLVIDIKVVPLANFTEATLNQDSVDGQDLNADNTMNNGLNGTSSQTNALWFLMVVVHPEAGTTEYPITLPTTAETEYDDTEQIWDDSISGDPQVNIYTARVASAGTDLRGDITVGGTIPANTAGAFYTTEVT